MTFSENELIKSIEEKNIENFNKNGGTSMYIYKKPEEEEALEKKNEILQKIKQIEAKYTKEEYVPTELQSLNLEEKTYEGPSEDEVLAQAEDSLKSYKEQELSEIDLKYSPKFSSLNEKAEEALEDKSEDLSDIESKYNSSLKKAQNSSIKKGISRSSIYENAIKEIEGSKDSSRDEVEAQYSKTIDKLENEKSLLEQQKDSALSSFDISYAVKLQSKITNLNNAIAKEQNAVLKYNQEIAKQEAAYIKEQEKAASAEEARITKKNKQLDSLGETEASQVKAQEKFNILYGYLSSLTKEQAMRELTTDSTYEIELGPYYTLLYSRIHNRRD